MKAAHLANPDSSNAIGEQVQPVSLLRAVKALFLTTVILGLLTVTTNGCRKNHSPSPAANKADQKAEPNPNQPVKTAEPKNSKNQQAAKQPTTNNTNSESQNPNANQSTGKQAAGNQESENVKVARHPNFDDFTDTQRNKDHTLFVIAFNSTTRQNYFMQNYPGLEPHQYDAMRQLIDSYEDDYQQLRDERARILNRAMDGQDVKTQLDNIKVEILVTSRIIRRSIHRDILTDAQKAEIRERNKERRAKAEARRQEQQ